MLRIWTRVLTAGCTIALAASCADDTSGRASSALDQSAPTSSAEPAAAAPMSTEPAAAETTTSAAPSTTVAVSTTARAITGNAQSCPDGAVLMDNDSDGWGICPAPIPTTTTEPLPRVIEPGVYLVGTEVEPGLYRAFGYWARLDPLQDIIDNGLSNTCPGLMLVRPTDSFVEIGGTGAVELDLAVPFDPIAEACTDGAFLVGLDLQPGQYRITPEPGSNAYWARLDAEQEILDNDLSEGQLIAVVQPGDWALEISGTIEHIG